MRREFERDYEEKVKPQYMFRVFNKYLESKKELNEDEEKDVEYLRERLETIEVDESNEEAMLTAIPNNFDGEGFSAGAIQHYNNYGFRGESFMRPF